MQTFEELGLSTALKLGVDSMGHTRPTPVQALTLPSILAGRDLSAQAQTGSGKTLAFGLGLLARLDAGRIATQALVLCPTRELADQVAKEIRALARGLPNLKVLSLCGGIALRPQLASLKHAPHVVVGTPGRIEELLQENALDFKDLRTFVLDEADRLLDMGFAPPIERIAAFLPRARQTLLFSATLPAAVESLSCGLQNDPLRIEVDAAPGVAGLEQRLYLVEDHQRPAAVAALLMALKPAAALIFCNTRQRVRELEEALAKARFPVQALHGELDQREREEVLVRFANRSRTVLVASDVAARGLDIKELPLVISAELAHDESTHLHRVGRTARAGAVGVALTLISAAEQHRAGNLKAVLGDDPQPRPLDLAPARQHAVAAPMATLVIDAGRQHKLRPGDLVGALTGSACGLAADTLGKIDSFATRTYVAVQRKDLRTALEGLQRGGIKGRKIRVRSLD